MPEIAEVEVRVTDSGTERTDRNLRQLEGSFGRVEARVISFNQTLDLLSRVGGIANTVLGASIRAAAGQERAVAGLNAQLQAQGRYSDAYVQQLNEQAAALQRTTTFADDAVTSAQAMLATFPALSTDVLPRATEAATDLASALGLDLTQAARTLGVALNDPATGLLRLSRSGVRFTEEQRDVIKALAEGGRVAEAQAMILDELESRFGGRAAAAAQTFSGRLDQLRNSFDDLLEEIGNIVVQSPAVARVLDDAKAATIDITEETIAYVAANRELIDQKIDAFFEGLPDNLSAGADAMGSLATSAASFVGALAPLFKFVTAHPEIAAGIFLGARFGPTGIALGAGAGGAAELDRRQSEFGGFDPDRAMRQWLADTFGTEVGGVIPMARQADVGPPAPPTPDIVGPPTAGDVGLFGPENPYPYNPPTLYGPPDEHAKERAAAARDERERQAEADRARALAERSAMGFASVDVLAADSQVAAAERYLALLDEQFEVSERLATTDAQRLAILTEGEQQQLAAARELDAARQQQLDAEIAVLATKREQQDLTAGERAELDAQIGQLEQQRSLIAASGGEAAKLTREFEAQRQALTQGFVEQAQAIRDSVEPLEALNREMARLRELAATVPEVGAKLTPEILDKYEANRIKAITDTRDGFDELIDAARQFGQDFSRTMAEALSPDGARISFRDFLSSLITDVNEFIIQKTLTDPILKVVEESVIKPIQGKPGDRSLPGFLGDLGTDAFDALFGGGSDRPPTAMIPGIGEVETASLDALNAAADEAGAALVRTASDTEGGFAGLIGTVGAGFTDLFGSLGEGLSSILSSLFGEDGFDIAGFFGDIIGGAVSGAAGGGTAHRGALVYHGGGLLRPGEVPIIAEAGELILSRSLTRDLLDTAKRGPMRRYHSGGLVTREGADLAPLAEIRTAPRDRAVSGGGSSAGPRQPDVYNINITQNAQSLDPRTTAQLLQQQSKTLVAIVRRDIARGGGLATDVGQRGG